MGDLRLCGIYVSSPNKLDGDSDITAQIGELRHYGWSYELYEMHIDWTNIQ